MLGQTEIERIADEILSELQAGDRTDIGGSHPSAIGQSQHDSR